MFKIDVALSREITVQKEFSELKDFLLDFNFWNSWSPWICLEPSAKTEVSGAAKNLGHKLSWAGELIGSGEMILSQITNNRIDIDLNFLKPFKSKAKVWFMLISEDKQTKIIWGMKTSLPFFLFFLRKPMLAYMGNDFERGLLRLKDVCEKGHVESKMSDVETTNQPTLFYLGINSKSSIAELKPIMTANFDKITEGINSGKLPVPSGFLAINHKFDLINSTCDITCGIFYHQKPENINGYEIIEMKEHKSLKLTHQGPYDHLGSAWSKVICYQRGKKIALNKQIPMYEFYLNSPLMVAPKDILTEVYIPIK